MIATGTIKANISNAGRIETRRLILRRWRSADAAPFAAIHAEPEMQHWLGIAPMTLPQARDHLARHESHFDAHGFGLWAMERRGDGALIGLCGLRHLAVHEHPLAPRVEIVWRQTRGACGQGHVAEAAESVLLDAFVHHGLDSLISFTATENRRSQRVMERLGMRRAPERDFDHSALPEGHRLRRHVVYELDARRWMEHLATSVRCA